MIFNNFNFWLFVDFVDDDQAELSVCERRVSSAIVSHSFWSMHDFPPKYLAKPPAMAEYTRHAAYQWSYARKEL